MAGQILDDLAKMILKSAAGASSSPQALDAALETLSTSFAAAARGGQDTSAWLDEVLVSESLDDAARRVLGDSAFRGALRRIGEQQDFLTEIGEAIEQGRLIEDPEGLLRRHGITGERSTDATVQRLAEMAQSAAQRTAAQNELTQRLRAFSGTLLSRKSNLKTDIARQISESPDAARRVSLDEISRQIEQMEQMSRNLPDDISTRADLLHGFSDQLEALEDIARNAHDPEHANQLVQAGLRLEELGRTTRTTAPSGTAGRPTTAPGTTQPAAGGAGRNAPTPPGDGGGAARTTARTAAEALPSEVTGPRRWAMSAWYGLRNQLSTWKFHYRFDFTNRLRMHNALKYWHSFSKYMQVSNLGRVAYAARELSTSLGNPGQIKHILDGIIINTNKVAEKYTKTLRSQSRRYQELADILENGDEAARKQVLEELKGLDQTLRSENADLLSELRELRSGAHGVVESGDAYKEAIREVQDMDLAKEYARKLEDVLETEGSDSELIRKVRNASDDLDTFEQNLSGRTADSARRVEIIYSLRKVNDVFSEAVEKLSDPGARDAEETALSIITRLTTEVVEDDTIQKGLGEHFDTISQKAEEFRQALVDVSHAKTLDEADQAEPLAQAREAVAQTREALTETLTTIKKEAHEIGEGEGLTQEMSSVKTLLRDGHTDEAAGILRQMSDDAIEEARRLDEDLTPTMRALKQAMGNAVERFSKIDSSIMDGQVWGLIKSYWEYYSAAVRYPFTRGTVYDERARFEAVFGKKVFFSTDVDSDTLHQHMRFIETAETMQRRKKLANPDLSTRPEDIAIARVKRIEAMIDLVTRTSPPDELEMRLLVLEDFIIERLPYTTMKYDVKRAGGLSQQFVAEADRSPKIRDRFKAKLARFYSKQEGTANVERLGGEKVNLFYKRHVMDRISDYLNEIDVPWFKNRFLNPKVWWGYLTGKKYDLEAMKQAGDAEWGDMARFNRKVLFEDAPFFGKEGVLTATWNPARLFFLGDRGRRMLLRPAWDLFKSPYYLTKHYGFASPVMVPFTYTAGGVVAGTVIGGGLHVAEEILEKVSHAIAPGILTNENGNFEFFDWQPDIGSRIMQTTSYPAAGTWTVASGWATGSKLGAPWDHVEWLERGWLGDRGEERQLTGLEKQYYDKIIDYYTSGDRGENKRSKGDKVFLEAAKRLAIEAAKQGIDYKDEELLRSHEITIRSEQNEQKTQEAVARQSEHLEKALKEALDGKADKKLINEIGGYAAELDIKPQKNGKFTPENTDTLVSIGFMITERNAQKKRNDAPYPKEVQDPPLTRPETTALGTPHGQRALVALLENDSNLSEDDITVQKAAAIIGEEQTDYDKPKVRQDALTRAREDVAKYKRGMAEDIQVQQMVNELFIKEDKLERTRNLPVAARALIKAGMDMDNPPSKEQRQDMLKIAEKVTGIDQPKPTPTAGTTVTTPPPAGATTTPPPAGAGTTKPPAAGEEEAEKKKEKTPPNEINNAYKKIVGMQPERFRSTFREALPEELQGKTQKELTDMLKDMEARVKQAKTPEEVAVIMQEFKPIQDSLDNEDRKPLREFARGTSNLASKFSDAMAVDDDSSVSRTFNHLASATGSTVSRFFGFLGKSFNNAKKTDKGRGWLGILAGVAGGLTGTIWLGKYTDEWMQKLGNIPFLGPLLSVFGGIAAPIIKILMFTGIFMAARKGTHAVLQGNGEHVEKTELGGSILGYRPEAQTEGEGDQDDGGNGGDGKSLDKAVHDPNTLQARREIQENMPTEEALDDIEEAQEATITGIQTASATGHDGRPNTIVFVNMADGSRQVQNVKATTSEQFAAQVCTHGFVDHDCLFEAENRNGHTQDLRERMKESTVDMTGHEKAGDVNIGLLIAHKAGPTQHNQNLRTSP